MNYSTRLTARQQALVLFSLFFVLIALQLPAQSGWVKDSIHFDKGIQGTPDFEQRLRVHFTEYDAQGNPMEDITRRQNAQGEWELWRRRTYTYANEHVQSVLVQFWDAGEESWQDGIERNYQYTSAGEFAERLFRKAPELGSSLENDRIWTYNYNPDGFLSGLLYQTWSGTAWENVSRQTWTYEGDNFISEQVLQLWNGAEWENHRRRAWSYADNQGGLEVVTAYAWDADNSEWDNLARRQYLNAGSLYLWTGIVWQTWDEQANAWMNVERQLFNYTNGVFKNRELHYWVNGAWEPKFRGNYTLENGLLNSTFGAWDTDSETWEQAFRFQSQYEDGRLLLDQGWQRWDADGSQWVNDTTTQRNVHFWSELMSSLNEPAELPQLCSYPNPYSMGTAVYCPDLEGSSDYTLRLLDLQGRVILEKAVSGSQSLGFRASIAPGLYVLIIQEGRRPVHVQKLNLF